MAPFFLDHPVYTVRSFDLRPVHTRKHSDERTESVLRASSSCVNFCIIQQLSSQLDVPERVTFKLDLMRYRCLHGQAPRYLADHIKPAIEVASRHRLRSANRHRLIVPRCRLNTYGRRAFSVAGPTCLLYTSPSPRDRTRSRMPSSA